MEIAANYDDGYYTYNRANINERKSEFDTDTFMKLLSTQLEHQDPFEPMSNKELSDSIAQMADVDSLDKMKTEMVRMNANMDAMNASSMVGKQVVASSISSGDIVSGIVTKISRSGDSFVMTIKDDISGNLVESSMGSIKEIH